MIAQRYLETAQRHQADTKIQALAEIVELIKAKQTEIAEKLKTTENVMGTTGIMVASIQDK